MRRTPRYVLLLALLLLLAPPAGAWGPLGHRLVAALAWDELTPPARAAVAALLAGEADPTLPGIANWADQLRASDPTLGRRSAKWHYVNLAEHDCRFDAARDCRGGNCLIEAIRAQTAILADRHRPRAERAQALKFVVHFIGDLHQPLHAGYARDRGGNTVQVNLDGAGSNLHKLWDSGLLYSRDLGESAYLRQLRALPSPRMRTRQRLDATSTAEASCRVVVRPGFYPTRARIDARYVRTWRPVAETQLRLGGVQLAAVLNDALGH